MTRFRPNTSPISGENVVIISFWPLESGFLMRKGRFLKRCLKDCAEILGVGVKEYDTKAIQFWYWKDSFCAWTTFIHQMTVDSFHKLESKSGPPVAVHWSQRTAITSRGFLRLPATSAQLLTELMQLQPTPCVGFCYGFNAKLCLFSFCLV